MAGFSGCMRERVSGRGAALAEGRRAGYPTPIVRAVSCYETRRDETSKRGRGSRARRRGSLRVSERGNRAVEQSQPSDGQTDGLRVLSFLLSRTLLLLLLRLDLCLSFSCCFSSRAGPAESKPPM